MAQSLQKNTELTEEIHRLLKGHNNTPGFVESTNKRIALNKQSISRVWWWLGSISIALISGAVGMLYKSLS